MKTLVPLEEAHWVLDQAFRRARMALDTAATVATTELENGDVRLDGFEVELEDGTFQYAFGRTSGTGADFLGLIAEVRIRAVPQDDPLGLGSDDGGES